MLFKQYILDGIRDGKITLAFRRWKRATVKASRSLNTPVGLLHIQTVEWIDETQITSGSARKAGCELVSELLASPGEPRRLALHCE